MSTRALIFKANDSFECAYESLNHRINCCKFNLCNDIEKNPGPTFIDPKKTLCAPYSQDFIDVFGVNAGKQCVGMSLCALLYKYRKGTIKYSADLIMIMDMGNELYSMLSRITGQMYLLLTELPETLTIEEVNYGLHFSESYSGQLHNLAFNEDIPHVMPLQYAFENLLQEGYISFLLTIGYNTVSIFTIANGFFKVFDSHGRDSCGMADPTGTCVLLEVNSILYLVEYFRTLHRADVLFELKGVHITIPGEMEIGNSETHSNITPRPMIHTSQEICNGPATIPFDSIPSQKCCAICHYSLCFSTIMSCKYWSDSTLSAITEHGISFGYNEASKIGKIYSPDHLPDSINIYDAVVQISYNAQKYDTLQLGSITSKQVLKNLIMMNIENNTGFFMWVSNFNISCIFQDDQKRMTKYFLVTCNETQTINVFKELGNVDLLVDNIFNIVFGKRDCEQVQYKLNFLSCVCDLTKSERQRIMRKHRSGVQKRLRGDKRKECHKNLEPEAKKRFLEKCASNYANMDAKKKLLLCEKNKQKYSSMDSSKKEALVKANKEKYLCITQIEKEIMSQRNKKEIRIYDSS
jgi:hypothetical protein